MKFMIAIFIVIAAIFVAYGCGNDVDVIPGAGKEIIILDPKPSGIEVGTSQKYVLDPSESSTLVKSGEMFLEVKFKDDKFTSIGGEASVETVVGPKSFDMARNIENEILTIDFISALRVKRTHQAAEFKIDYIELTPSACDVVRLTEIKDMPGARLEPTICLGSKTMPKVKVTVKESGMFIPVTFKAL